MTTFDTFDRTGAVEFPFGTRVVFHAVEQAVSRIPTMQVAEANRMANRITAKVGMSAMSWGEKVAISITEAAPGRSRVSVASAAKSVLGSATTHGKNRRNVDTIISATASLLEQYGAEWSVVTGEPTPQTPGQSAPQSGAEEIEKLAGLHQAGILTDEEFSAKKRQILGI
ncbi:MAG: SHOCT domain-containing protein [Frankiaceae bacterium]|nr:SHOCT domain-containing protein [Frankiaceae bacterium]MBV9869070.1 SHOCT domain-containing protein [Frankiaceae bacterium]